MTNQIETHNQYSISIIHELAHVISDLGGFKSCLAASGADFSAPEVDFYYPFKTRLVVLGMTCKFCIFAVSLRLALWQLGPCTR